MTPSYQSSSPVPYHNDQERHILPLLPLEKQKGFAWKPGIFSVLDLGSTKAMCLIGRGLRNGSLEILGWGWRRSEGITSGSIVDTKQAEAVIRATVGDAEKMAGERADHLTVNLSCGNPFSQHVDVVATLGGQEVTEEDIHALTEQARLKARHNERTIIHTLPLGFKVDETQAVFNPCGHLCTHLTGKFHIIDANSTILRTLDTVLQRAELNLSALVCSPFASGMAALEHDERELGITLIEMGAGTTSLAVFSHGKMLHSAQIRVGGHHITRDIASALSVSIETAEWLKTRHGAAQPVSDDEQHLIALPTGRGTMIQRIPRSKLVSVIAPRIEETLEMVRHSLETAGLGNLAKDRIVLTGGGALLNDLGPVAARIFGRQVRIGQPRNILNLPDTSSISTGFSTAAGLLAWAAGADRHFCAPEENPSSQKILKRLVNLVRRHV